MRFRVSAAFLLLSTAATPCISDGIRASGELKSGIEIGAAMASYDPMHVVGPWKGTRTCPVC